MAIYRVCGTEISPPYRNTRPNWFSKFNCFKYFVESFYKYADIYVIWDGEKNRLFDYIKGFYPDCLNIISINYKSNAKSMLECYALAESLKQKYENVYFSEDDWLYLENAGKILTEGFNFSVFNNHLLCLYDRPHGYRMPQGDTTFGQDYIFYTGTTHFRSTESCMYSFGLKMLTFLELKDDLIKFCNNPTGAIDREMFREFAGKGRRLFNPIPGQATHCVDIDLPLDWNKYTI